MHPCGTAALCSCGMAEHALPLTVSAQHCREWVEVWVWVPFWMLFGVPRPSVWETTTTLVFSCPNPGILDLTTHTLGTTPGFLVTRDLIFQAPQPHSLCANSPFFKCPNPPPAP